MSVSIKYKGAEIASASTEVTKTIKTAGKYCEADILVENTPDGGGAGGNYNIESVDDGNGGQILNITDAEGGGSSRLPAGYQEVTFLASYGGAHIDTLHNNNSGWSIEYRAANDIFHGRNGSGGECFYSNAYFYNNGKNYSTQRILISNNQIFGVKIKYLTTGLVIESADGTELYSDAYSGSRLSGNVMIFGTGLQDGNGTLFYAKLYDNSDNLIRDFVPCYRKADSVAGLYDLVNNAFFENTGAGQFVTGGDIN